MLHEKRASSIRQVARCTLQVARFTCCCTSHVPRDIARCDTQRNWQSAKLISLEGEKLPPVGNACHTIIALFTCWLLIKIRESCTRSSVKQAEVYHIECTIYSRTICKERENLSCLLWELNWKQWTERRPFRPYEYAMNAIAIANVVLAQYSIAVNVKMESRAHHYSGESVPIPPRPRLDRQQNATKWHWTGDGATERWRRGCDSLKCSLCLAYWLKTVCIMRKPAKWQQGGSGSAEWDISSQYDKALAGNSNFPAKNADENMFLRVFVPSAPTLKSDCCWHSSANANANANANA